MPDREQSPCIFILSSVQCFLNVDVLQCLTEVATMFSNLQEGCIFLSRASYESCATSYVSLQGGCEDSKRDSIHYRYTSNTTSMLYLITYLEFIVHSSTYEMS